MADLILHCIRGFDVILGMDWLANYHASMGYSKKVVTFNLLGQSCFEFKGSSVKFPCHIISSMETQRMIRNGF